MIGADGFGHAPDAGAYVKVPQVGSVVHRRRRRGRRQHHDRPRRDRRHGDRRRRQDRQPGADRRTTCRIGAHTVIAGCSGISGSTIIGRRCMIGGMVGHRRTPRDLRRRGGHRSDDGDAVHPPARRVFERAAGRRGAAASAATRRASSSSTSWRARRAAARRRGSGADRETAMSDQQGGFGIDEVMRRLPHRYPDAARRPRARMRPGQAHRRASRTSRPTSSSSPGTFPGRPVMPGVMILEALAQAAGILTFVTAGIYPDENVALLFRRHRQGALPPPDRAGRPADPEGDARAPHPHASGSSPRSPRWRARRSASAEMMVMPG